LKAGIQFIRWLWSPETNTHPYRSFCTQRKTFQERMGNAHPIHSNIVPFYLKHSAFPLATMAVPS
jgi:hypothetical protein